MGQTLKRFLGQTAASQTTGPLPFDSQCPNLAIPKKNWKGSPLLYFLWRKKNWKGVSWKWIRWNILHMSKSKIIMWPSLTCYSLDSNGIIWLGTIWLTIHLCSSTNMKSELKLKKKLKNILSVRFFYRQKVKDSTALRVYPPKIWPGLRPLRKVSMFSMDLSAGSITRMDPPNKFAEKEEDEIFYTCENRRSSSDQVWLAIVWIETALSDLVPFDLPSICVLPPIWHLNSSWKKSWKKF